MYTLCYTCFSFQRNANTTQQILCHSLERKYVLTNLPWLIGSLGTMAEDVMIFIQFHVYRDDETDEDVVEVS